MSKKPGKYSRKVPYDPDVSRVISCRVHPETLKALRMVAAQQDTTVCAMLTREAERLAVTGQHAA